MRNNRIAFFQTLSVKGPEPISLLWAEVPFEKGSDPIAFLWPETPFEISALMVCPGLALRYLFGLYLIDEFNQTSTYQSPCIHMTIKEYLDGSLHQFIGRQPIPILMVRCPVIGKPLS